MTKICCHILFTTSRYIFSKRLTCRYSGKLSFRCSASKKDYILSVEIQKGLAETFGPIKDLEILGEFRQGKILTYDLKPEVDLEQKWSESGDSEKVR